MRILHVLDHSLPLYSGYSFRTAAILREQRALGWETVQLTAPRHQSAMGYEDVDGWRFHRTPLGKSPIAAVPPFNYVREMVATHKQLEQLIASFRPDIVQAHSPVLNAIPALCAGRRHGVPVVYEVRALWEDGAVDLGTTNLGSARYRISRALESFVLRRVDHVTTICEGLRGEIEDRGIKPESITVIPNAVDVLSFGFGVPPDPELRTKLGLNGATVLGYAGSFYAYEGLDLAIDAMARLSHRTDLRLLLVGGGPQEQALKKRAELLGVAARVHFAGRIPQGEVPRYYGLMDILVYPRHRVRVTDLVTPLKPLEAMAQGRVVVASDVGGHRELIRDDETGFLFRAGDSAALAYRIEAVLARRAEWDPMRIRAREFVENHRTWTRSVARYAPVYRGLLAKRGTPVSQSTRNA